MRSAQAGTALPSKGAARKEAARKGSRVLSESAELPAFTLQQSGYEQEVAAVAARLQGPVCQIGARAQMIDAQTRTWRSRMARDFPRSGVGN